MKLLSAVFCSGFVKEMFGSAEGQKALFSSFWKYLMVCRAVLQFSELSSASTDSFNPSVCVGPSFGF